MEIKTLENTPLAEIVNCFNEAFAGYFVPIIATEEAMQSRWRAGRVDYGLSVGAFENGRLVAFMIIGTDNWQGRKTAYNAGTGVIPEFRGRKLVAQLYDYALPLFRNAGIEQCTLEVICQNEKAIKAYQQVGFEIVRTLPCFKAETKSAELPENFPIEVSTDFDLEELLPLQPYAFSWDNNNAGLDANRQAYQCFRHTENGKLKAYALLNPENGYLAQIGFQSGSAEKYLLPLLLKMAQTQPAMRINNVDASSEETISVLKKAGFVNHISQYEMQMLLPETVLESR